MEIVDLRDLALKKVVITGNVIGKFGTFEIEQTYKNNTKNILEVGYTFPIVETATVVGFEINIGDKVLKGKCKETNEAKKEYAENIVKGNSSYMMEQETDNIFKISVGKIDVDEEVKVKIQYIDKFEIVDNTIKILMPTLVTPRYKSNITEKLTYGKVDYTIDFNIKVSKSLAINSINSESHNIKIYNEEDVDRVEVLNYDMSKDFKLDIELKNELSSNAITSKTREGNDVIYLSFMPEITDTYEDIEKEYLFIIDISGSMTGRKLKETKRAVIECLKQLDNGDKFNIIPFESDFEAMNIDSIEFNETNMKKAIKYVENLDTLGGTEILAPIKFALYEKETNKIVLLFTDGQVGNEDEIIKFVENNISRSRIFPFGIDTNVNASFIRQLAKVGNGKAELIQPNEKIDDKIIRTFARIQTPLLEEIKVDYGKNEVINEIREDKCLFNYEFFNIFSKLEKISDDIILKGKILDKEYTWTISKEDIKNTKVDLEVLFTKLEMERLEEYIRNSDDNGKIEAYKKMIIDLAIKYNINSKYTSFITVYERENKLLDIPEYQDTSLSNKFAEDAMEDYETCADMGSPYESIVADAWRMRPSTSSNDNSGDLDIPCFLRKNKSTGSKNKSSTPYKGVSIFNALRKKVGSASEEYCDEFDENEYEKSDYEICIEKIEEYYNTFKNNNNKSILTYLLYAVYFLERQSDKFNYTDLLKFLEKNRDEILASELYMKLILLCYYKLADNRYIDKKETLELLNDNFKKIAATNLKVIIEKEWITDEELKEIVKNDKIIDNIDDVLWYISKENIVKARSKSWIY